MFRKNKNIVGQEIYIDESWVSWGDKLKKKWATNGVSIAEKFEWTNEIKNRFFRVSLLCGAIVIYALLMVLLRVGV